MASHANILGLFESSIDFLLNKTVISTKLALTVELELFESRLLILGSLDQNFSKASYEMGKLY